MCISVRQRVEMLIKLLLKLSFEPCLVVSPCGRYKNLNNVRKVKAVLWVSQPCFAISGCDVAEVWLLNWKCFL